MKVLGITGGMGSGKSTVSQLLKINGMPVYNTDIVGAQLSNFSPVIRRQLTARYGDELYQTGVLNRPMLATLIFNRKEDMKFVNSVIHPEVQKHFEDWKTQHADKAWTGIESAILFESGFHLLVDQILLVTAPLELRIERVRKRDGLDRETILQRIRHQLPDEQKAFLSEYVLINDNQQAIIPQICEMKIF
ncbi:MAG: dephospho-CoA kinase [Candidatus Symbiothrix sp.]|jgi:dephospho-CoA kinase|nr:dephospho-CoA kinase [Candidatus Symbiothrix sp.]